MADERREGRMRELVPMRPARPRTLARQSADAVPTSRLSAGAGDGLLDGLLSALRPPERVVVAIETVSARLASDPQVQGPVEMASA